MYAWGWGAVGGEGVHVSVLPCTTISGEEGVRGLSIKDWWNEVELGGRKGGRENGLRALIECLLD